jgi:hypothetical protein
MAELEPDKELSSVVDPEVLLAEVVPKARAEQRFVHAHAEALKAFRALLETDVPRAFRVLAEVAAPIAAEAEDVVLMRLTVMLGAAVATQKGDRAVIETWADAQHDLGVSLGDRVLQARAKYVRAIGLLRSEPANLRGVQHLLKQARDDARAGGDEAFEDEIRRTLGKIRRA